MNTETTIRSERTKLREGKLFALGLSKRIFGFAFKDFFVSGYNVEWMRDYDWFLYLEYITENVALIKGNASAQVSDKEKLKLFGEQLTALTGPELKHNAPREIMDQVLVVIKDLNEFMASELKKLPDESAAGN